MGEHYLRPVYKHMTFHYHKKMFFLFYVMGHLDVFINTSALLKLKKNQIIWRLI